MKIPHTRRGEEEEEVRSALRLMYDDEVVVLGVIRGNELCSWQTWAQRETLD